MLPSGETRWVQGRGRASPTTGARRPLLAPGTTRPASGTATPGGPGARGDEARRSSPSTASGGSPTSTPRPSGVLGTTRDEAARRVDLGAVPRRRSAAPSRSTTGAPPRRAGSGSSRRTTRSRWTRGSRCVPGPAPDGLSVYFLDISERRVGRGARPPGHPAAGADRRRRSAVSDALDRGPGGCGGCGPAAAGPAVVPVLGDWVIASLVGEDGQLHDVASWHRDPALRGRWWPGTPSSGSRRMTADRPDRGALRVRPARMSPDVGAAVGRMLPPGEVRDVFRALAPQTAIALPLQARGRTLGALSIYRLADRPPPDADESPRPGRGRPGRAGAGQLAPLRAAAAARRGSAAQPAHRAARARPRRDRRALPAGRGVAQVGGDWYDAFLQPTGATMLVIGDVVGHDTAAAAAMGQLRGMLRGIAYREGIGAGRRPHRTRRRDRGPRHGHDGHRGHRPGRADAAVSVPPGSRGSAGRTRGTRRRW